MLNANEDVDTQSATSPMEGIEQEPQTGPSIFDHPMPQESTKRPFQENFPGASSTWNTTHPGKTFMELFAEDPFTSARVNVPYYPFSMRDEWEVASFLLQSGMSMAKIDEFLKLKMVLLPILSVLHNTQHFIPMMTD